MKITLEQNRDYWDSIAIARVKEIYGCDDDQAQDAINSARIKADNNFINRKYNRKSRFRELFRISGRKSDDVLEQELAHHGEELLLFQYHLLAHCEQYIENYLIDNGNNVTYNFILTRYIRAMVQYSLQQYKSGAIVPAVNSLIYGYRGRSVKMICDYLRSITTDSYREQKNDLVNELVTSLYCDSSKNPILKNVRSGKMGVYVTYIQGQKPVKEDRMLADLIKNILKNFIPFGPTCQQATLLLYGRVDEKPHIVTYFDRIKYLHLNICPDCHAAMIRANRLLPSYQCIALPDFNLTARLPDRIESKV